MDCSLAIAGGSSQAAGANVLMTGDFNAASENV